MTVSLNFENGDISLDRAGDLSSVDGLERVRQKILQRLRFFRGEWFLAIDEGVPYREKILVHPANAGIAASLFNKEILEEDGVTGIGAVSSSLDYTTRKLEYRASVQTIYGDVEVEV